MTDSEVLYIGDAVALHGISGEIRLHVVADSPDFAKQFKRFFCEGKECTVQRLRIHKNCAVIKFDGVDNPDAARLLVGKGFFIARDDVKLPKGSYFIADILGFEIVDNDTGAVYGQLTQVQNHGAGDIYYIKTPSGEELLFPAVAQFVARRDFEAKRIFITPIPGMFE